MEKMKMIAKILSPIVGEVLRIKKWRIFSYIAGIAAFFTLPSLLKK